jgi:hypothetical protein
MLLCVQWCPFVFQEIAIPILWTMTSWKGWIVKSEPCLLLVGFFEDYGNDSSTGTGGDIQEKKMRVVRCDRCDAYQVTNNDTNCHGFQYFLICHVVTVIVKVIFSVVIICQ